MYTKYQLETEKVKERMHRRRGREEKGGGAKKPNCETNFAHLIFRSHMAKEKS